MLLRYCFEVGRFKDINFCEPGLCLIATSIFVPWTSHQMFNISSLFSRELEELEAIREAEEAALAEAEQAAAEAAEAMEGMFAGNFDFAGGGKDSPEGGGGESGMASPSRESTASNNSKPTVMQHHHRDSSTTDNRMFQSYENVDRETSETGDRMSVRSATLSVYRSNLGSNDSIDRNNSKLSSLPASPFVRRTSNSFSSHVRLHDKYGNLNKKPLVLFTYLDAQEHLPYADDSTAVTPKSELNGGIVVDTPTRMGLGRKYSYNSHTGKVDSYNSHTDLRYAANTKEDTLRKRMASLFSDRGQKSSTPNSILLEPCMTGNQYEPTRKPSCLMNNGKDSVDIQVRDKALMIFAPSASG